METKEILKKVVDIFATNWELRAGRKVPDAEDIQLDNDAVEIEASVLYADMKDSTGLVDNFKGHFAAEIYKAYLESACRIIRNNHGQITAFDGDRVMAVFYGDNKNTSAVKTALQISFIVSEVNQKLRGQYPNTTYTLKHAIGIDTSKLFVAKAGIKNSNDLIWIGRAANYAAKLCTLATDEYPIHITKAVFGKLNESAKYGGTHNKCMWEERTWTARNITVYRSSWIWKI